MIRREGIALRARRHGLARLAALLSFGAALAVPADAASFDPEAGLPRIRNFTPEVYRGHSQIFATARTAEGVMYFGTYGTVVSFDGERWRQYPLPGTWTRALAVGPDGLLYVGGGNQLGRLQPAPLTGELQFVSLADRIPEAHRAFTSVWSAAATGNDVLFSIDGAVLSWRDNAFRAWTFPAQRPALRAAGSQIFCHVGDQLLRWRGADFQPFLRDPRLGAVRRLTVLPADRGVLLALDNGQILRATDDGTLSPWETAAAAFLANAGIRNGLRLPDGGYLLSTSGEGVVQLTADGAPVRRLADTSGLANSATYGLGHGVDQHIWIETANGLSVVNPLLPWGYFDPRNGRADAIGGEPLRVGRDLVVFNSDVPPRRLAPAADPFRDAQLVPFTHNIPGRLANGVVMHDALITGGENGIMLLGRESRLLQKTSSQTEDITTLASLPDLLVVGMLRGVEFVRVKSDFTTETIARVPDFDHETTNVAETRDRTVWAGTTAGVVLRLQLDPLGAIVGRTLFDASRGLPAGAGWTRIQSFQGEPVVMVKQGVFHLDPTGQRLVPDPRFARYFPAGVNNLPFESDDRSRFWFQIRRPEGGFELGCLTVATDGTQTWTPLPAEIGASLGFSGARSIVYLTEAGREILWVAGTLSAARIDLAAPTPTTPPPLVVVSEIVRGANHWRPHAEPLRLDFSRDSLRLLFASPSAASTTISYETRLLGYDARWTAATAAEATFTNLYGGPFTFEVRARDALGRVGEPARTTFSIAPPWQRTGLAYAGYALALGGAVFGFVRWRLGQAARERRRLEGLVAERTRDLAAARDQAETASRAKSAFLASMSHELRTPLNGVIGYAQVLQGDRRLLPDQQERVRIVQSSGEHLLRMINDVLDLAKIEAGKLDLRLAPFALGDLVRDIAAAHRPAAEVKGLDFRVEAAPHLPEWVEGDVQKVRQILDNLVGNAIKFTVRGRVTLRVHHSTAPDSVSPLSALNSRLGEANSIAFAITDTGPGISAPDQVRLFQPFEQATAAPSTAPGTGLGLAISRALVERMGGTLTLTSTPGAGSTFSFAIALPVIANASRALAAAAPASVLGYAGPRRRLVIVDDHPVNRALLVDLLQPLDFTCTAFESGASALAALTSGQEPWPDLVIVDVRMEGLDGLALTRQLRTLAGDRALRVLLTSASVLTFNPADGHAAGCDDFLPKPFRTAELLEKIAHLLALTWHRAPPAQCHLISDNQSAPTSDPNVQCHVIRDIGSRNTARVVRIPEERRAGLRDALALGDIEEVRRLIAAGRAAHPEAAMTWQALDDAAAGFQLSQLRQLLENA